MPVIFVTGGSGFIGSNLIPALRGRGDAVRALARSDTASQVVANLGATAVRGDLDDVASIRDAMRGCDTVVHLAGHVAEWGPRAQFQRINVDGTRNVLAAARDARVPNFVHLSSDTVLVDGGPLVRVDERRPMPRRPYPRYAATKAAAESLVLAANGPSLRTIALRATPVWGAGDTSVLPQFVSAVRRNRFAWIGGGRFLTSTCHVANCVEGLLLAIDSKRAGEVYFITDGAPVEFRDFMTRMLATQGVQIPNRNLPVVVARGLAETLERLWDIARLPGQPPLTRLTVCVFGKEATFVDTKARRELGYTSSRSVEDGLRELAQQAPVS